MKNGAKKSGPKNRSKWSNAVILPEYGISLNHPKLELYIYFFEVRFGVSIPLNLRHQHGHSSVNN